MTLSSDTANEPRDDDANRSHASWRERVARSGPVGWLCGCVFAGWILISTATLLAPVHWAADLLANLRVQWALVGLVFWICLLAKRRYTLASISFLVTTLSIGPIVAANHFAAVVRPTPASQTHLRPDHVQADHEHAGHESDDVSETLRIPGDTLKVAFVNVRTRNRNANGVIEWLSDLDADVIAVLEVDSWWHKQLGAGLPNHPHRVAEPRDDGNFGISLYSRMPWKSAPKVIDYGCGVPTIDWERSPWGVRIIATHPFPPMNRTAFRLRNQQLLNIAQNISDDDVPTIVMGDFNLTPWSPWFDEMLQIGHLSRCTEGLGVKPTWARFPSLPDTAGFPVGLVLDHVLVSRGIRIRAYQRSPSVGSDHRGLCVQLELPKN